MSSRDHASYEQEVGAYLLGALTDLERQAFEQHLAGCAGCREEIERLRPAADSLPRSVEQLAPPAALKASLMEVVEREARERRGEPSRPRLRERVAGLVRRPAARRPLLAACALALGLLAGYGVAQVGSGEDGRRVVAKVDDGRVPSASATLTLQGDGQDGGILRLHGLPSLASNRVYQAWVEREGEIVPQPTFEIGEDGGGAVAVPEDLSEAEAVLVTREARGGARAPGERPIIEVRL
jgi:Anti-sigma-K factor rskA/Putative zinc-finger